MTTDALGSPPAVPAVPDQPRHAAAFTDEATYAATRLPVELASTLLPAAYTSGEFYSQEQERVFATSWAR